jgi:hypothetical protein
MHPTAQKIVHHSDFMTTLRKVHGRGPSEIAIAAENQNTHKSKVSMPN